MTNEYTMLKNFIEHENVDRMHDAILCACDISLGDDDLRKLFILLPEYVRNEALSWGTNDTVFGDLVYTYAKEVGAMRIKELVKTHA